MMNDKLDLTYTAEDRIAWWFVKAVVKRYLRVNECTLTDQEVDDCAENGYHLANAIKRARAKVLLGVTDDAE